jgi:hypothetical protein
MNYSGPCHVRQCKQNGKTFSSIVATISSGYLKQRLGKLGVVPQKSKIARLPDCLTNDRHVWRGCMDGDGTLRNNRRYSYAVDSILESCNLSFCGHKDSWLLGQFQTYIKNILEIRRPLTLGKNRNVTTLYCAANDALVVAKHLYEDCTIALPRKLVVAQEWCKSDLNFKYTPPKHI